MTDPLPQMPRLLLGAAGTLARREGPKAASWPSRRYTAALPAAHVQAYQAFFGGFTSPLPLTLLYPLAQRSHLARMLDADFPYAVPGMIHLSNEQAWVQAPAPEAPFVLEVSVAALPADVPGGHERVAFETRFLQDDRLTATCRSVYLARRGAGAKGPRDPEHEAGEILETWAIAADEGRRYAALSGDYNPIHLSPWLSRWFGFPRPIMHGMDAVGRVAARLERQAQRPVTQLEVEFKRAVPLPSTLRVHADSGEFQVASEAGVIHLKGRYRIEQEIPNAAL